MRLFLVVVFRGTSPQRIFGGHKTLVFPEFRGTSPPIEMRGKRGKRAIQNLGAQVLKRRWGGQGLP